MTYRRIIVCLLLSALLALSACTPESQSPGPDSDAESGLPDSTSDAESSETTALPKADESLADDGTVPAFSENAFTVEESQHYKIVNDNFLFYYWIFDANHDVAKYDGPLNKYPRITMVNDSLVKFILQAGTGISTQWGYYYDIAADSFSETFQCIYDESVANERLLAYGDKQKVVVRDIFDSEGYCREFTSFDKPISIVAEPIVTAEFTVDGSSILITYMTDDNNRNVTEIMNLN